MLYFTVEKLKRRFYEELEKMKGIFFVRPELVEV
jgi:hypothetical protein